MESNGRITRDEMLMGMAQMTALRSTCSRGQVGAIVARGSRPVVGGYNGAPAGMPHCHHTCDCYLDQPARHELIQVEDSHNPECKTRQPCLVSVHAEANCVAWAARHGVSLDDCVLYTTMAPCLACSMLIINAGIKRVCQARSYRDASGIQLLAAAGVEVWSQPLTVATPPMPPVD